MADFSFDNFALFVFCGLSLNCCVSGKMFKLVDAVGFSMIFFILSGLVAVR